MIGLLVAAMVETAVPEPTVPNPAVVRLVAVSVRTVGAKQALVLEASAEWGAVTIKREGAEIVATLAAESDPALTVPPPVPPLRAIELDRNPGELRVRIAVPPDVPYEVHRDGMRISLLFGPVLTGGAHAGLELYRSLFPAQSELAATETLSEGAPAAASLPGFGWGPLRLQPSLTLTYFDAEATITGPDPVRDRYFQAAPDLGLQVVLLTGYFRAAYQPHFRMRSNIAEVNVPSHDFDASLQLPIGQRFTLGLTDHYAITTLDTPRADPGREYFFDLGRFTRNDAGGFVEMEVGPRLKARVRGGESRVRFSEEDAGFFSYDLRELGGRLDFLLSEASRFEVEYTHAHVPPPPLRPVSETTSDTWTLGLEGDLPALIKGRLAAGVESQEAPRAAAPGDRYRGLTVSGNLSKELGRTVRVAVDGGRHTFVSGFEQNAFYVSSWVNGLVEFPIAAGFFGRAGTGYRWNSYRIDATGRSVPRHDDIFDWTVGAGRTLTRWTFLRIDYVRDRRDSNLVEFDSRSRSFMIQFGITPFSAQSK